MTNDELKHELSFLMNNFKQYVAGNTYNGVALTVTGDNSWTTRAAIFRPYKTIETSNGSDAYYRMDFNIWGSTIATQTVNLTITGITFSNRNWEQVVAGNSATGAWNWSNVALCNNNTNTMYMYLAAGNQTYWCVGGTVELASWPTWADIII